MSSNESYLRNKIADVIEYSHDHEAGLAFARLIVQFCSMFGDDVSKNKERVDWLINELTDLANNPNIHTRMYALDILLKYYVMFGGLSRGRKLSEKENKIHKNKRRSKKVD